MSIRYVIFDLDGTLIDSYQALTTALNRTGAELLKKPLTLTDVRDLVGEGVERLLEKAFGTASAHLIARFEEEYEKVCRAESRMLDHVEQTLEALERQQIAMAVCTNKPTSFSRAILEHLGISRHFGAVVGPDLAGARKPDPQHVLHTLAEIGGRREATLFVGDMPIDIAAARAAEIRVAAIATGSASAAQLRAADPDIMLQRFSDLLAHCALHETASR